MTTLEMGNPFQWQTEFSVLSAQPIIRAMVSPFRVGITGIMILILNMMANPEMSFTIK